MQHHFLTSFLCVAGTDRASLKDNNNLIDNSETVYISSLALLKMLRHGRAGVPMEVMGLMLGEFVDDFTVRVVDVFAMPQSGTGVSVEAVDPGHVTSNRTVGPQQPDHSSHPVSFGQADTLFI
jgi:hypothetical protein